MSKLNQEQREKVNLAKSRIEALHQLVDEEYDKLLSELANAELASFEEDWLFDYIFNSNDRAEEILFE